MKGTYKNKWSFILTGLLGLFALLLLSILFWRERVIYTDMAFHSFVMSVTKSFAIQNNRFGAALTQMFPLTAMYLELPLAAVLKWYSAGFYVLYIAYFLIIVFVLRQQEIAIVMVLYLTLLCSNSFFWAQSEYPQGMAFMCVFLALTASTNHTSRLRLTKLSLVLIGGTVTVFFHPLIVIPLTFGIVFLMLQKKVSIQTGAVVLIYVLVLVWAKSKFIKPNPYETSKMDALDNFVKLFPDYLHTQSNLFFLQQLFSDYALYAILFLGVVYYLTKRRQWFKLSFVIGATILYLLLINVTYPDLYGGIYLQNMHLTLGFFVALPVVYDLLPQFTSRVQWLLLLFVFTGRIFFIFNSHTPYTNRIEQLSTLIEKARNTNNNRHMIDAKHVPRAEPDDFWALSYETLLLSSLDGPMHAQTIEVEEVVEQYPQLLKYDDVFINRWWGWDTRLFPQRYFKLSKSRYMKLEL